MADFSYCYLLDIVSQGDMQPTPEGMDALIQVLGKKDVEKEMERRRTDPTYVPTLPSKQFIAFYFSTVLSEKSDAYNPDHLSIEELTRRIEHFPEEGETKTKGDLYLMRGGQLKSEKCTTRRSRTSSRLRTRRTSARICRRRCWRRPRS